MLQNKLCLHALFGNSVHEGRIPVICSTRESPGFISLSGRLEDYSIRRNPLYLGTAGAHIATRQPVPPGTFRLAVKEQRP